MTTLLATLLLLRRGATAASATYTNPDRINCADGQDKLQAPGEIGFPSLSPHLLAQSIDRYHVAAGSGVRPDKQSVTVALRLKAQRTFVHHNMADEPSTLDENKATRYRTGGCERVERDDRRLYGFVKRHISRCSNLL